MNITDEMLSAAAPEAAERWLNTLPGREDCGHGFSLTFEASMAPLLRRRRRRWRTLALLAAVVGVLAALLASGAVADRPDNYRVYAAQEEGFVAYRALPKEDGDGQPFHQLTPEWVPEGFVRDSADIQENQSHLAYRCQDRRSFHLYQWHGGEHVSAMMGRYRLENVRVGGEEAILFTALDGPQRYLLWTQGADAFLLYGWDIPQEDLFLVAGSLKW